MEEAIKLIGERLRGLRDALDLPAEDVANLCGTSTDEYLKMEQGERELSVSKLQKIARKYEIPLDVLLFGEEPRMKGYFLTRKGRGLSVARRKAYHYESLASGFRGRNADPFIVTIEPKGDNVPIECNSHAGQEFNLVLEGAMQLTVGDKTLTLNEGDSIYFDATQPHGMRTLNDKPTRFLAIIL